MKRLTTREFKTTFHRITDPEPIEILNRTRTIGFYFPGDVLPAPKGVVSEQGWDPIPGLPSVLDPRSRTVSPREDG
jgi:hypothetical protein